MNRRMRPIITAALIVGCSTAGCTVGPTYRRPAATTPAQFKEAAGWTPGQPADDLDRGAWWAMFHDPTLDGLERQVAGSNQTVKEYEAAYRAANAVTSAARATLFPTVGADAGATVSHTPAGTTTGSGATVHDYTAALEASWVPDLWGKVRRTVESDKALAQASAGDLNNARLAAQASLAEDYFAVRVLDEQARLDRSTVRAYQDFLTLTQNQVREGTQARSAVLTAEAQLYAAQAALLAAGVQRAAMEHAIAVLIGLPPAQFTLASAPLGRNVPVAPAGLPSHVLERRPDIAAAERRMASENALIGVAVAAYYPSLTLSGEYGTGASNLGSLFGAATSLWSVGGSAAETLLDFGARRAQVREARANYDEAVATYRQTVLTAFQGVEDELATLRIDQQEYDVLLRNEAAAHEAVQLDLAEYKQGTVDYTTVITAQAAELSASQNVLTVLQSRLQASVLLVEDLGGGW